MTTYNTGNAIGSTDARDLSDNAQNLDNAVNGPASRWTDRLGVSRPSWAGITSYADRGAYGAMIITGYNEIFLHDGEYYRAAAATTLPYTLTGSWSDDGVDFVPIGDANLRSELPTGTFGAINGEINVAYFGTLEEARTNSEASGMTIVVTTPLTDTQSNITADWPPDRALEVRKGGSINPSTIFAISSGATNHITPDWFPGNDAEKIESAINVSIASAPHIPIVFDRMMDITGLGSITINKPADYGDRNILYFQGSGGGIKKTDAGIVFTGATALVGDINVSNMRFESTNLAGTILWDCNSIMRINSHNNDYVDWDTILLQDDIINSGNIVQSCYFSYEHMVGGRGVAFSWVKSSNVSITHCLAENRGDVIVNGVYGGADPNYIQNHNLVIADNVFEGLYGISISLGSTWGCSISRNYLENNTGGYIDLNTKQTTSNHYALVVENNAIYLSAAQQAANYKPIIVGDLFQLSTAKMKINCNRFSGNVSDGELYDVIGTGILNSVGDYAFKQTGFDDAQIRFGSGHIIRTTPESHTVVYSGLVRSYSFSYSSSLLASETKTLAIAFTDTEITGPLNSYDHIVVYPGQITSVSILGILPVWTSATTGTLYIIAQNRTAVDIATATFQINVLLGRNV